MNKKKVLCGGCFDILHIGHINFLGKARGLGNYLIILLESDENIRKLKGKNRPFHNAKERLKILKSLKFVDKVIVLPENPNDKTYIDIIKKIGPDVIAVTEGDPIINIKKNQAKLVGAKFAIVKKYKSYSTTHIAKILKLE